MYFVGCDVPLTRDGKNRLKCVGNFTVYDTTQLKAEIHFADENISDFNAEAFSYGFGAMLTLFVVGLGTGLIISQIRKMKI